jgi:hypothetical protein
MGHETMWFYCFKGDCCLHLQESRKKQQAPENFWYINYGKVKHMTCSMRLAGTGITATGMYLQYKITNVCDTSKIKTTVFLKYVYSN